MPDHTWSIAFELHQAGDGLDTLSGDRLTELDVLNILTLSLRPGLKTNARGTVTIREGKRVRLQIKILPSPRGDPKPQIIRQ